MTTPTLSKPRRQATDPDIGDGIAYGDQVDDVGGRGELTIADQVVEKIATTALSEIEHVGGAARRVLGVALGSDAPDRAAQVRAQVSGSLVTLQVVCRVTYPEPVATITAPHDHVR